MDILEKAKLYAIDAHAGAKRKGDKEKPYIIHPLEVANILKRYGFDDNVIAAGYLHDVVEDTNHSLDEIKETFGSDIASLVEAASEPDKTLPWEERKEHTINTIKTLDLRHKAVIAADKISNLSDLRILFEIKGKYDFSAFKRGFEKQKWYYSEVLKSLKLNTEHEILNELSKLVDYIFNGITNDEHFTQDIFTNEEYKILKELHFRKEEIKKLSSLVNFDNYTIEITGTPRTGKTYLINNLSYFFENANYKVNIMDECEESKSINNLNYKDIYKSILDKLNEKRLNSDFLMADRLLLDNLIWVDKLYNDSSISEEEYNSFKSEFISLIKANESIIICLYADTNTSLKRDYINNLSLEKRKFLNETNINSYNNSLNNIIDLSNKENLNVKFIDTTDLSEREISIIVARYILNDLKSKLLVKVNNNEELKRYN